jgi:hypothetical protein
MAERRGLSRGFSAGQVRARQYTSSIALRQETTSSVEVGGALHARTAQVAAIAPATRPRVNLRILFVAFPLIFIVILRGKPQLPLDSIAQIRSEIG